MLALSRETGTHQWSFISPFVFVIDLWQQEKERCLRRKGIKRRIWERCPDCRTHHHSEWYSLITLLLLCYSFSSASLPDIIQTPRLRSVLAET